MTTERRLATLKSRHKILCLRDDSLVLRFRVRFSSFQFLVIAVMLRVLKVGVLITTHVFQVN